MTIGRRDRLWTILARNTGGSTFSDSGGETFDPVGTNPNEWGSWEPMKGNEKWAAQQFVSREVARVRMRYRDDVDSTNRISNSELGEFEIIGEPERRRRDDELVLHVSRVLGD